MEKMKVEMGSDLLVWGCSVSGFRDQGCGVQRFRVQATRAQSEGLFEVPRRATFI